MAGPFHEKELENGNIILVFDRFKLSICKVLTRMS